MIFNPDIFILPSYVVNVMLSKIMLPSNLDSESICIEINCMFLLIDTLKK